MLICEVCGEKTEKLFGKVCWNCYYRIGRDAVKNMAKEDIVHDNGIKQRDFFDKVNETYMDEPLENATSMENDYDSGPVMISNLTGIPLAQVKAEWPVTWKNLNCCFDMLYDLPGMHFMFLAKHKIPFRLIKHPTTQGEFKKTGVLLHFSSTAKRWVVKNKVNQYGISLNWGDGELQFKPSEYFIEQLFKSHYPPMAYEIGTDEPYLDNKIKIYLWCFLSFSMMPILWLCPKRSSK